MAKAMIISVGTGRCRDDIANAILLSIKRENPDKLVFLVSPMSGRETLPIIKKGVPAGVSVTVNSFAETDDVEEIYLQYMGIIRRVIADGCSRQDIVIDYTSGTKAMSAALFAAGIAMEVGSINYIAGKRDATGRVIPGKERPIPIKPLSIFAENRIREARALFNRYQFQAAGMLIQGLLSTTGDPSLSERAEVMLKLIDAYHFWDTFRLRPALDLFGKIRSLGLLNNNAINDLFEKNFRLLNQSCNNKYSVHRLADLYQNILRRITEGKYDDATARIYRLFEYMAQVRLYNGYNRMETGKIRIEALPNPIRNKYRVYSNGRPEVQLSMVRAFGLLSDLKDDLGIRFCGEYSGDQSPFRKLLNKRNRSILAHGFASVSENDCKKLLDTATDYLDRFFPDWKKEKDKALFPQL